VAGSGWFFPLWQYFEGGTTLAEKLASCAALAASPRWTARASAHPKAGAQRQRAGASARPLFSRASQLLCCARATGVWKDLFLQSRPQG